MKTHHIIIPVLAFAVAGTSGYSQALGYSQFADAGVYGGITAGAISVGEMAAIGAAVAAGIAVASNSNNSSISHPSNVIADKAGTSTCSVTIRQGVTTVAALAGTIVYTAPDGAQTKVDIGTGLIIDKEGKQTTKTLSQIIADEKAAGADTDPNSVTAGLAKTIQTIAANVSKGEYGKNAGALMAAVIKTAGTANPSAIGDYAQASIAALAGSKTLTPEQKQAAAKAVIEAALRAAPTDQREALERSLAGTLGDNAADLGMSKSDAYGLIKLPSDETDQGGDQSSASIIPSVDPTIVDLVSPSS